MSDKIGDSVGLVPLEPEVIDVPATPVEQSNSAIQSDFEESREKLLEVVTIGQEALKDLAEFARSAPSARVFEVLTALLATQSDNSMKIMDLHKKNKELSGNTGPKQVTNQLILTTTELQKLIGNKDNRN